MAGWVACFGTEKGGQPHCAREQWLPAFRLLIHAAKECTDLLSGFSCPFYGFAQLFTSDEAAAYEDQPEWHARDMIGLPKSRCQQLRKPCLSCRCKARSAAIPTAGHPDPGPL
jgi:hypothetical protein